MKRYRRSAVLVLVFLAIVAFLATNYVANGRRFERGLPFVHQGMEERDVIALLGKPDITAHPCWAKNPACSFDDVYSMPFTVEGFWVISFDDSRHVIDKQDWYSP